MKNRVGKIVVLFIVAMFFLMSISAHAETGGRSMVQPIGNTVDGNTNVKGVNIIKKIIVL